MLQIHRDHPLDRLTTFGLKSIAEAYAEAHDAEELREAFAAAKREGWRVHVIGGGSNTIAMPRVRGLVLRAAMTGCRIEPLNEGGARVEAGAGELLDRVVRLSVSSGFGGLENLAMIPGTVGGAVVQNVGAYGLELAERFERCRAYDPDSDEIRTLSLEECDFGYRHSVFKTPSAARLVVLSADLRLPGRWRPTAGYKDLAAQLSAERLAHPTPADVERVVRELRARKLPDPKQVGNAGSFFKNPVVNRVKANELLSKHPSLTAYPLAGGRVKLAAAWLIEAAGLKGLKLGRAAVYARHALILVNEGGADGEDVAALSRLIVDRVKERFGVTLEPEPVVMGEAAGNIL